MFIATFANTKSYLISIHNIEPWKSEEEKCRVVVVFLDLVCGHELCIMLQLFDFDLEIIVCKSRKYLFLGLVHISWCSP